MSEALSPWVREVLGLGGMLFTNGMRILYGRNTFGNNDMIRLVLVAIVSMWACLANAGTWYVAAARGNDSNGGTTSLAPLATIQKAVSKASDGDVILVDDGVYDGFTLYKEHPDVYKNLTIRSVNGPTKTFIKGGVRLGTSYAYSKNKLVDGFSIGGGSFAVMGGDVNHCIISGVDARNSNVFSKCYVYNCLIYGNQASSSEMYATKLYNCTIYENHGDYIAYDSNGTHFYNCIIFGSNKGRYVCSNWGSYAYNCWESDPLFVNLSSGDFRLKDNSPCIDKGNNSYVLANDKDILGNARIVGAMVDIGCYEYVPQIKVSFDLGLRGKRSGGGELAQFVDKGAGAIAPKVSVQEGWRFAGWDREFSSVSSQITVHAVYVSVPSVATRYPWNGLVDLAFAYEAPGTAATAATLSVRDLGGNTNVTVRSVSLDGKPGDGLSVVPGAHKILWDAWSDLPHGFVANLSATLTIGSASNTVSFPIDLRGLGPWERRVAQPTETISYSSDWQGTEAGSWSCGAVVPAAWKPSAGNVLKGREPVHVGTRYEETDHVSAADPLSRLTNGRVNEAGESWDDTVAFKDGTLTWALTEPTDITLLRVNTHWKDGGRDGISFSAVEYQVAGDDGWYELSGSQVCFGVKGQDVEDNEGGPDLEAVYRASNGRVVAQNVVAIRFVLGPQDNSGTGYTEFEAVGTPSSARHAVVKVYPCLKEKPKYIAIDLSGGTNATRYPIEYLNEVPADGWTDEYKTSKLVLRHIPAGSFIMGGRNTDYPGAVNTNLHMVTLTRDFYMGVFEVTQRQWELVMGNRPSAFSNETCYATRPVEQVSMQDIRGGRLGLTHPRTLTVDDTGFMGVLRCRTGLSGLDLPTTAQWEFACRAGTTTALNSGRDIPSAGQSAELDEVSRNCFNSGYIVDGELLSSWNGLFSATDEIMTARVGTYLANRLGLYDMHGNVWEYILDNVFVGDSVDPLGWREDAGTVGISGGSFEQTVASLYTSDVYSFIGRYSVEIPATGRRHRNVGFRLCLQGGVVPDFASASLLIDETGDGNGYWSALKAGSYCLTHAIMSGLTTEQLLSACFEVGGPRLSLSANGELEPGVGVTIAGNEPGWTLYYTTDGAEPTTNSTTYAGAIILNETATIRAVAFNAQGVRSEEVLATFTLHDALGIASAVAIPRYPWNGKVDVDIELKGDSEARYLVELVAKDLAGGTNLPVRTVYRDASLIPNPCTLIPAKRRLLWDAAADIVGDFDFNRVAVTVKATGSHLLAYPKTLELTVAGYAGTETLADVPTLVRLSTAIEGFSYDDFATTNGSDLAFFTPEGQPLPYEIDEWNVGGESLVWVKLPELRQGTRFTCAYGAQSNNQTIKQSNNSHAVWRDYAGVWHMNEPSGTAFDSTEHRLDGIPSCGTNTTIEAARAEMVAYAGGACGRARSSGVGEHRSAGNYMLMPSYSALGLSNRFVVSGWFNAERLERSDLMVGRMYNTAVDGHGYSSMGGWHIETRGPELNEYVVYGATNHTDYVIVPCSGYGNRWEYISVIYDGEDVVCYSNGQFMKSGKVRAPTENDLPLSLGMPSNAIGGAFTGRYDEIRLRGGSLSADRIKADYDMIANREFLSYGVVTGGKEAVRNE